jgi:WD40 repeat protein
LNPNDSDLERTTSLMFEIGTGVPAAEIKSVFEVTKMSFSNDGKFLAMGSATGTVCVWALGQHLHQNIS